MCKFTKANFLNVRAMNASLVFLSCLDETELFREEIQKMRGGLCSITEFCLTLKAGYSLHVQSITDKEIVFNRLDKLEWDSVWHEFLLIITYDCEKGDWSAYVEI